LDVTKSIRRFEGTRSLLEDVDTNTLVRDLDVVISHTYDAEYELQFREEKRASVDDVGIHIFVEGGVVTDKLSGDSRSASSVELIPGASLDSSVGDLKIVDHTEARLKSSGLEGSVEDGKILLNFTMPSDLEVLDVPRELHERHALIARIHTIRFLLSRYKARSFLPKARRTFTAKRARAFSISHD